MQAVKTGNQPFIKARAKKFQICQAIAILVPITKMIDKTSL